MATQSQALTLTNDLPVLHRTHFPCGFVFGTASSSYQYEGAADKRGKTIWDTFCHNSPWMIKDRSNGKVAADFHHRYREDVRMMKDMGLDAFRFSISWSRLLQHGKRRSGVSEAGVKFYNDLINELLANGIQPYVTLFHWDLPQPLEDKYGGFLSPQIVDDFSDFADLCFSKFGDRVKHWITFNEPWSYCYGGYVTGSLAPGHCTADARDIKAGFLLDKATGLEHQDFGVNHSVPWAFAGNNGGLHSSGLANKASNSFNYGGGGGGGGGGGQFNSSNLGNKAASNSFTMGGGQLNSSNLGNKAASNSFTMGGGQLNSSNLGNKAASTSFTMGGGQLNSTNLGNWSDHSRISHLEDAASDDDDDDDDDEPEIRTTGSNNFNHYSAMSATVSAGSNNHNQSFGANNHNQSFGANNHNLSFGANNHNKSFGGNNNRGGGARRRKEKKSSSSEPYTVAHHQLLCHAAAVNVYRKYYKEQQKGIIGITLVTSWFEPYSETKSDRDAASRALDFCLGWFMDPLTTGDYPDSMKSHVRDRLPTFSANESRMVKGSFDFIGLNYYTANYAANSNYYYTAKPSYITDSKVENKTERNGVPIGTKAASDWLYIYPQGLWKLLLHMKNNYNNPTIYITENGMDEVNDPKLPISKACNDRTRIDYHYRHLNQLYDAIKNQGVNVK